MPVALHGLSDEDRSSVAEGADRGEVVAAAVCWARDLVNRPAAQLTPRRLAHEALRRLEADPNVTIEIWREVELEAERCGGLLGVVEGLARAAAARARDVRPGRDGAAAPRGARRQGDHVRLGRPQPQDLRGHDDDEDGHDGRGRRARCIERGRAGLGGACQGHGDRAARREPPGAPRDEARRRAHRAQRHHDRGAEHRRRGSPRARRRAEPRGRARARRHHRRGHADGAVAHRARLRGRGGHGHRPRARRRASRLRGARGRAALGAAARRPLRRRTWTPRWRT